MPTYTPHKLANEPTGTLQLSMGERVVALVDLPGVPAGTKGKVMVVNGFNRFRYWVRFENGVERSNLDGRHIAPLKAKKQ